MKNSPPALMGWTGSGPRSRRVSGFSLIELVVAVAIIGIISAIAFPSYREYVQRTGRTDATIALSELAQMMERYFTENNAYKVSAAVKARLCPDPNPCIYPSTTARGLYTLSIADLQRNSYEVRATAVATESQAHDLECKVYILRSNGTREVIDANGTRYKPDDPNAAVREHFAKCWRG